MKSKYDSILRNLDVRNIDHIKEALDLNDLELIDSIGQGAFGSIYLIKSNQNSENNNYYVAKVRLIENFKNLENEKIKQESNFTKLNNTDFIKVILEMSLKNGVISINEWAEVGDMSSLTNNKRIPENIAFIVFYRICKAIKSLHKKKIIHRDIKLENILIKLNGEIKLCDLGLARKIDNNENEDMIISSFVGSPLYLSPEIILGHKGLYCIDIWCIGVLLYILVYGYPPFKLNMNRLNDKTEYINNIIKKDINYDDPYISEDCQELLKKILNKNGKERITLNEILNDKWVKANLDKYGTDDDDEIREMMAKNFLEYIKGTIVFKNKIQKTFNKLKSMNKEHTEILNILKELERKNNKVILKNNQRDEDIEYKDNIEYFKSIANELDKNFYKIVGYDKTLKELKRIFQKYQDDY